MSLRIHLACHFAVGSLSLVCLTSHPACSSRIQEMLSKNAVVLEFTIAQAYQPKIKHLKDAVL